MSRSRPSQGESTPPMDLPGEERRQARLHRSGGSLSVVIPKAWLEDLGIHDKVELVRTNDGVFITPLRDRPSIEDEPEFAIFLDNLLKDALAQPGQLGDVGELLEDSEGLFGGVETD